MPETVIGVDVSKDWVDVFGKDRGAARIEARPGRLAAFARRARRDGALVVFEATGGYDRALMKALDAAGVAYARVNPRQARDFARALGVIGKSDRVDARMLAEMGARLPLRRAEPVPPTRRLLQALAARRRQLVEARKQETCRKRSVRNSVYLAAGPVPI